MRLFFIIVCLVLFFSPATAQKNAVYDSSSVTLRSFSDSAINAYRDNPSFQYEKQLMQTPSLWDRFWQWVWRKYMEITSTKAGRITMNVIYWTLAIAAVVFFLYKVTRMNRMNIFSGQPASAIPYKTEIEDIHAISFDTAINEALENGNYRLAIRFLYLQLLKLLSEKELIHWRHDKTNEDYRNELQDAYLKKSFGQVTNVFEYAWYGSHEATRDDFSTMEEEVLKFKNQM